MIDIQKSPLLKGHRVSLRCAREGDEAFLINAGQHGEIAKMYGVPDAQDGPISPERAENWLKSQIETPFAWVIEYSGNVIGALRFHSQDQIDRRASFAIGLFSPANLDQGLGSEAMALAFDYGFEKMNLHRISLRVLHFNARAIAAYKKLGFEIEGRERQSACIGGEWHDDIIMGLLDSDFAAKKAI